MSFDFTQPLALLLLLILPAFWLIDRVSRTHLPAQRRRLVLVVRLLVVALIIVGLAGPRVIGRAEEQAVAFLVMPLAQQAGPEVLVRQLETPAFVREGDKFTATLTLEATQDTQAKVHLLADGRLLASQDVNLTQGSNSIVLPQEPLPPGFHLFRVQVEASADTYIQNNEGGSYTVVTGKPRVLIITADTNDATYLADALRSSGLDVDVKDTSVAVIDLPTLRGYESVILANVPAADMSASQMRALNSYVQNLGGGLVVIGGEQSYG